MAMSIVNLESLSPLSHSIRSSQFVHQSLIFLVSYVFIFCGYEFVAICKSQSLPKAQSDIKSSTIVSHKTTPQEWLSNH